MAESLPRYRKAGVMLADIPRIDFGDRRESARSLATLDDRLGQLSQWALGEAADRAKDEGLQYGAENPVTLRQLKDAEGPKAANALFQPRNTVFGEAARMAQVDSITADVTLDAQEQITRLKLGVERGEVDIFKARDELKALIDGSGKALMNVDPKASLKLRSSLGTLGNSAYQSMIQAHLKREDERKRVAIDDWISNVVPEQVRTHFDMGDTVDPETGKVITPQQRIIATLHTPLRDMLAGQSDEYARQADKRFADAVAAARVDAVSAFVVDLPIAKTDPSAALAQIRSGNLGKYSATWKSLTFTEQEKVVTNFMQMGARTHLFDEQNKKQLEQDAKAGVYNMLARYWDMRDGPQKNALKREIVSKGSGVLSFDQLKSLLKPEVAGEAKENTDITMGIDNAIHLRGVTDLSEIQRMFPGASKKQLKHANDLLLSTGRKELDKGIRLLAGVPEGLVQMTGDQARRRAALENEANRLMQEERTANAKNGAPGMYNPSSVLANLRKNRERITANKAVDAARERLESYGASKKNERINENTSEDELKRLKFTPQEINEIRRNQKTIRGD